MRIIVHIIRGNGADLHYRAATYHTGYFLLNALAKMWYSESQKFRFLTGEMIVILEDVHRFLRVPIQGKLVEFDGDATQILGNI